MPAPAGPDLRRHRAGASLACRTGPLHRPDRGDRLLLSGGYALLLAPTGRYQAASVNYGGCPKDAQTRLRGSCPIVGSYGGKDPTPLGRGAAARLERALTALVVDHDVKQYPDAGHAFLNDQGDRISRAMRIIRIGYHEPSARTRADASSPSSTGTFVTQPDRHRRCREPAP